MQSVTHSFIHRKNVNFYLVTVMALPAVMALKQNKTKHFLLNIILLLYKKLKYIYFSMK